MGDHQSMVSSGAELLQTCIRNRHSTREFLTDPVNPEILKKCLDIAQQSPSNSNIQNWRLFIVSGSSRDRLSSALMAEARKRDPDIPPLPDQFKKFRSELGGILYGKDGYNIDRSEKVAHQEKVLRNYEFFDAPVYAVLAQDKGLASWDYVSAGMYLQTLILLLTEQGLGTCAQATIAGFPDVVRRELDTDMEILCGLAIGWPKPGSKVNKLRMPRSEVDQNVKWL